MPHPDEDFELPGKPERRPSHFRKKRPENTTKVVRVARSEDGPPSEISAVVRSPKAGQNDWANVINPAPALPDPVLQRPIPPPAPLPSESAEVPVASGWVEDRAKRKRTEDIIGTVGLALMVAAMLAAMWLRMTGP